MDRPAPSPDLTWTAQAGPQAEFVKSPVFEVVYGVKRTGDDQIAYRVADPSILREDGGPSIAERMGRIGGRWRPADNTRVARLGAFGGWDQVRARIKGNGTGPMLVVFDTCRDFIRTVPVLQHDPAKAEDLDTNAEDHVADETRYACLSRPMTARNPVASLDPRDLDFGRGRRSAAAAANWKVS